VKESVRKGERERNRKEIKLGGRDIQTERDRDRDRQTERVTDR
jgi:hypothetical protein